MRCSGVLLPVSALPSQYGIGTIGKAAFDFVDYLTCLGCHVWQMLPNVSTGYGDSPYQSISVFAGNPYFIDLEMLCEKGLLFHDELRNVDFGSDPCCVDYYALYKNRLSVLKTACMRLKCESDADFIEFCSKNSFWLDDYADFMAIREYYSYKPWFEWDDVRVRMHDKEGVETLISKLASETLIYKKIQYLYSKQWQILHEYAKAHDISIIGDMPIYTALDSADVWANRSEFMLDDSGKPLGVAGVPPDYFSKTGQLWGNPLYNYGNMAKNGYKWWINRMKHALVQFDMVRIDHFRGFASFYCIPAHADTAQRGKWISGPGIKLFEAMQKSLGNNLPVIAEDLGFITPDVTELVQKTGFHNMAVLEFAFDSDADNVHLPHNCHKNQVIYTGTHDNATAEGWWCDVQKRIKIYAHEYMHMAEGEPISDALIRTALGSVCDYAIMPMQDILRLNNEARMNLPESTEGNWRWRLDSSYAVQSDIDRIYALNSVFGRI